jgi:phosphoserine phosphatase
MPLVATLISHPAEAALDFSLAIKASAVLGASGVYWLADRVACDLPLRVEVNALEAEATLRDLVKGAAVDIVVQDEETRRKKILIADMDSTMIDQECIDELADELGIKAHVAAITARAMNGEIAFEPALRERVALLKDLPCSVIDKVIESRITLASGGPELVRTMKANGGWAVLVSGGFTRFTRTIAERIGFDESFANTLIERDGTLSGEVVEPILGRRAKADALVAVANRLGLAPADSIAVGDGANDLDMLQLAGTGVALHAKPTVAAEARFRIDHGDLTALLYIQGYRKEEFAA